MADWSTPVLASTYVTVLDAFKNRDIDAAVQFSPTFSTATNLPTGTIRWNPTNGYWEVRAAGGTWSALQAKYMIDVDKLDGQDGAYYLAWANITGVPSTFAPSAHTHDDRYFTETESDARYANKIAIAGNTIKLQTFNNVDLATITLPYASDAGTVSGYSVNQNLLTTSGVTFASLTLGATLITATAAEINFIDGVTSNVQTQLDAKQATITGAATSIVTSNLTASRALTSDASGKVAISAVTATELGYLTGVTSAVQTQISAKANTASPTFTGTVTAPVLRLDAVAATLTSTGHSVQIGTTTGINLVMDNNDIQGRNNGAASAINLNPLGGNITLGSAASTVTIAGTLSAGTISLPANAVVSSTITDAAVTTSKLASEAVTAAKIAANAVGSSKVNYATGSFGYSHGSGGGYNIISVPTTTTMWGVNYSGNVPTVMMLGTVSAPTISYSVGNTSSGTIYWRYIA